MICVVDEKFHEVLKNFRGNTVLYDVFKGRGTHGSP